MYTLILTHLHTLSPLYPFSCTVNDVYLHSLGHLPYRPVQMFLNSQQRVLSLGKKATIHQLTTMISTSKNVLFPGHNHLLTTGHSGVDDPTLAGAWAIIKACQRHQRVSPLPCGYDLETGHF